jgi:hypothetical protein
MHGQYINPLFNLSIMRSQDDLPVMETAAIDLKVCLALAAEA